MGLVLQSEASPWLKTKGEHFVCPPLTFSKFVSTRPGLVMKSRNETGARKIKESITNLTAYYFHQNFSFTRSVVKVN